MAKIENKDKTRQNEMERNTIFIYLLLNCLTDRLRINLPSSRLGQNKKKRQQQKYESI